MEFSGGRGIDRTLEATGVPAVLRQAIDVVAPLGVCGIVGAPAPDADVSMNILTAIVKGSRVVGINQGDAVPRESIPALVELHRQGRFPFYELIRVYPFDDIQLIRRSGVRVPPPASAEDRPARPSVIPGPGASPAIPTR